MENNETLCLVHHGILGQKWGIRRYRNKDGTLTAAGKKRAAKLEAERKFLVGDNDKKKTSSTSTGKSTATEEPKKKPTDDMSNEDLQKAVARLNLEKQYNELSNPGKDPNQGLRDAKDKLQLEKDYRNLYNELHPKQESAAKKYVNQIKDSAVKSLSDTVAKQGQKVVEKMLEKYMGISTQDPTAEYRKEAKSMSDKELTDFNKRQSLENAYVKNKTNKLPNTN